MKKSELVRWGAFVVPIAIGLVASTSLAVDYLRPAPVFCGIDGACGAVRRTAFAAFAGIPTPVWGAAGFLALAVLATLRGRLARIGLAVTATLAAAAAGLLIFVQAKLGAFCPYCMAADTSALVVFALAIFRYTGKWDPPEAKMPRRLAGGAFASALAVPLALGFTMKPAVPRLIADEMTRTPKDKITVVDFVDFECPFCRETHAELSPVLGAHKDKIRLVRKHVPLSRIHPHAMEAARAACCGETLGKGDEFAEALFATPEEELTNVGCEKIAAQLGLDVTRFRDCLKDPSTDARIKSDSDAFRASGGLGLPTIWVNEEKLEGGQDHATLEAAVSRAIGS